MSLILCPECKKEVSDKAEICPHCGVNVQKFLKDNQLLENDTIEAGECENITELNNEPSQSGSSSNKRLGLFLLFASILVLIAIGSVILNGNVDIQESKDATIEYMDEYEKIDGHLLDTISFNGEEYFVITTTDMQILSHYFDKVSSEYNSLDEKHKKKYDEWLYSTYQEEYSSLKAAYGVYSLKENGYSSYEEFLTAFRKNAMLELAKAVEVVDSSLKADGNYYKLSAKLKNNTEKTISYVKYTIYLADENGNIVNSDWSNWSGTFKPDSTIMVDTMIERYDSDKKRYKIEIDEYN